MLPLPAYLVTSLVLTFCCHRERVVLDSKPLLFPSDFPPLRRRRLTTLQVNLGYRCNQSCLHCHVDAGPKRCEEMTPETLDELLAFLRRADLALLDITGGAPELNQVFRPLVVAARGLGMRVMDRCNLTILEEPGQEDLADFLAEHEVEVIASLPCYLQENVDAQRGSGTFEASLRGLRALNARGYGRADGRLSLSLVYNPIGASLPPAQCALEAEYKRELKARYGIEFNHLLTLANMPIRRFGSLLQSTRQFDDYLGLLKSAHQAANLEAVMCRDLISVDWQGYLYDCDFNQMLDLPLRQIQGQSHGQDHEDDHRQAEQQRLHLRELTSVELLRDRPIQVGDHCYGCTAGQGSSCSGALA
jgi:radical SAM/Cys-rich protein